jgi:hypothetical protein
MIHDACPDPSGELHRALYTYREHFVRSIENM